MVATLQGKSSQYFEATLQLRNVDEDFVDDVIAEIRQSGKCAITRIEPEKNGVDIYLSDKKYAQALGKSLAARTPGELKVTMRVFGVKLGTTIHRVTVFFRRLPFKTGDTIATDEGDVRVLAIGNKAHVKYMTTGKKRLVPLDWLERFCR